MEPFILKEMIRHDLCSNWSSFFFLPPPIYHLIESDWIGNNDGKILPDYRLREILRLNQEMCFCPILLTKSPMLFAFIFVSKAAWPLTRARIGSKWHISAVNSFTESPQELKQNATQIFVLLLSQIPLISLFFCLFIVIEMIVIFLP